METLETMVMRDHAQQLRRADHGQCTAVSDKPTELASNLQSGNLHSTHFVAEIPFLQGW